VIVPGLGAFISFPVEAKQDSVSGMLIPPAQSLGFNARLCHNDGLLANSIMKEKDIPFKEASRQIKHYVEQVEKQLQAGQAVLIPWVGTLRLNAEQKMEFTPDKQVSCNLQYYGLTNFFLTPLAELAPLEEETTWEEPTQIAPAKIEPAISSGRRMWRWVGISAAAVAALFLLTIPVKDYPVYESEKASIIQLPSTLLPDTCRNRTDSIAPDTIPADTIVMPPKTQAHNGRYYYIVIASLPTKALAEKKAGEHRAESFNRAAVISNDDKHRVYVDRFADKESAQSYLNEFKVKHPAHSKAWMLYQKGE
jgi:Sporulation related domain.